MSENNTEKGKQAYGRNQRIEKYDENDLEHYWNPPHNYEEIEQNTKKKKMNTTKP